MIGASDFAGLLTLSPKAALQKFAPERADCSSDVQGSDFSPADGLDTCMRLIGAFLSPLISQSSESTEPGEPCQHICRPSVEHGESGLSSAMVIGMESQRLPRSPSISGAWSKQLALNGRSTFRNRHAAVKVVSTWDVMLSW